MTFKPTEEQQAALDAFARGDSLTLTAGAGTGKTSTLRLLSEAASRRRGLYAAFNKAIATDAQGAFPRNVTVKTTHALAFAAVGRQYAHRLNGPRIPMQQAVKALGIRGAIKTSSDTLIQPVQQARLALDMATRFCNSNDDHLTARHLAPTAGLHPDDHYDVADTLLPYARRVWADWQNPDGDKFKFPHDAYVKIFALTKPLFGYDFLLFDEAQDTTEVMAGMVAHQQANGAQLVVVGDSAQAIYEWRGAVDAMGMFHTDHHLLLSQSFRFGPAVADEANRWLDRIGTPLRLTGTPTITSTVTNNPLGDPDVVLCRSNAGTISELMAAHEAGKKVAIVGGGQDARRLAEAAEALQNGRPTSHPELALFPTWGAVQDHVEQGDSTDLRPFVRLIDDHGPAVIMQAIDRAVPEAAADRTVSTAHKAKGREWDRVQIHSDFPEPRVDPETGATEEPSRDEAMLAYVAVTRARRTLGRGSLEWITTASPTVRPTPAAAAARSRPLVASSPAVPAAAPPKVVLPSSWEQGNAQGDQEALVVRLDADLMAWLRLEAVARATTVEDLVERLIRARRDWSK